MKHGSEKKKGGSIYHRPMQHPLPGDDGTGEGHRSIDSPKSQDFIESLRSKSMKPAEKPFSEHKP